MAKIINQQVLDNIELKINSKIIVFLQLKINDGNTQSLIEITVINNAAYQFHFSNYYDRNDNNEIEVFRNGKLESIFKNCILEDIFFNNLETLNYKFYGDRFKKINNKRT